MKKKIIKGVLFFLIGFVVFFGFRLLYGYLRYDADGTDQFQGAYYTSYEYSYEQNDQYVRKNIASTKYENKGGKEGKSESVSISTDQKYEKIGSLSASSKEFENTESKVRDLIRKYNALIQYEQKSGMEGSRRLHLIVGVPPEGFDGMIGELKAFGKLESIQIDKVDKTNEYKELEAKRISLEKTIASLSSLKAKSGKIDEYVNLENQILEFERQLQDLGVQLGDFDAENEFCTVKYSLREDTYVPTGIPFLQRAMVALEWTVKYYLAFVLVIAFSALAAFLIIKIAQLIRRLSKPADNKQE